MEKLPPKGSVKNNGDGDLGGKQLREGTSLIRATSSPRGQLCETGHTFNFTPQKPTKITVIFIF